MNAQKGYYSIVQYCPDLGRFEAVNIGVLLFCPGSGFLKSVTTGNNARIKQFFGEGHDWKRINAYKKGVGERLKKEQIRTLGDLKHFIAMRANVLQITDPKPMKVFDPERDLAHLFAKLVGGSAKKKTRTNLDKMIGGKFSASGLERKIVPNVTVKLPVLDEEVELPFGYQNGRFNLIKPVRFNARDPRQAYKMACKYAIEGQSFYDHPDDKLGELQLIVVGQFPTRDEKSFNLVQRVFKEDESKVKLFRTDQLPKLIDEIERTGKDIDQPATA